MQVLSSFAHFSTFAVVPVAAAGAVTAGAVGAGVAAAVGAAGGLASATVAKRATIADANIFINSPC